MLTTADVVADLRSRGIEVTGRRLRDWRRKGLLPPLMRHGRGQGQGTCEVWEDPWISNQAAAIYGALAKRRRASGAILVLAGLGFQVPISRFHEALRRWLDALTLNLPQLDDRNLSPAAFADLLARYQRQELLPRILLDSTAQSVAFHELSLQIFLNPRYEPSRRELLGWGADEGVEDEAAWYRRHGSAPVLDQALTRARDDQLAAVLAGWHELMLSTSEWLRTGWDAEEDVLHVGPVQVPMERLMPWLFLVDIHMQVDGVGQGFLPGFVGGAILELIEPPAVSSIDAVPDVNLQSAWAEV